MTTEEAAVFAQMLLGVRMQIDGLLQMISKPVEEEPQAKSMPRTLGDESP